LASNFDIDKLEQVVHMDSHIVSRFFSASGSSGAVFFQHQRRVDLWVVVHTTDERHTPPSANLQCFVRHRGPLALHLRPRCAEQLLKTWLVMQ
jgi:hypothetical protein